MSIETRCQCLSISHCACHCSTQVLMSYSNKAILYSTFVIISGNGSGVGCNTSHVIAGKNLKKIQYTTRRGLLFMQYLPQQQAYSPRASKITICARRCGIIQFFYRTVSACKSSSLDNCSVLCVKMPGYWTLLSLTTPGHFP